jgi:predicted nicotinamide N-methyase
MEVATTTIDDLNGTTVCENAIHIKIPTLDRNLHLSLIQREAAIEPMFSGASWAGSVLWPAAKIMIEEILMTHKVPVQGNSVLELGCGLGIPGMICSLLGGSEVVLTEQPQLVPLINENITSNFNSQDLKPVALSLSWGKSRAEKFLEARSGTRFSTIIVCDCVFEPLYGDSWKLLCETLVVLADSETSVLISCERRREDSIPEFLELLGQNFSTSIIWSSFEDAELDALLTYSHIAGQKKPIRVYMAKFIHHTSREEAEKMPMF